MNKKELSVLLIGCYKASPSELTLRNAVITIATYISGEQVSLTELRDMLSIYDVPLRILLLTEIKKYLIAKIQIAETM